MVSIVRHDLEAALSATLEQLETVTAVVRRGLPPLIVSQRSSGEGSSVRWTIEPSFYHHRMCLEIVCASAAFLGALCNGLQAKLLNVQLVRKWNGRRVLVVFLLPAHPTSSVRRRQPW